MLLDGGSDGECSEDLRPLPALLNRPKVANHIVHESFTMDTRDHEDHTFCGIMFDVRCRSEVDGGVPLESIVIDALCIRGDLGPLTVWTTPETYAGKEHRASAWQLVYEKEHTPSRNDYARLELGSPIRLAAGESCGLYVHSKLQGDEAIVYDNIRFDRHRNRLNCEDQALRVLPGQAHLSNQPFGRHGMWWGVWRTNREFVGRISYGVSYLLWNPAREVHRRFPPPFRKAAMVLLLCARRPESPLNWVQDDVVYYILNMCKHDWFSAAVQDAVDTASLSSEEPTFEHLGGRSAPGVCGGTLVLPRSPPSSCTSEEDSEMLAVQSMGSEDDDTDEEI